MIKVAFIQEEVRTREGIMALSSVLKAHGHDTDIFATDEGYNKVLSDIKNFRPNLIAFSTSTPSQENALTFAKKLKKTDSSIFIIMGGPHPTFYPQVLEQSEFLDAICIGEGEHALLELVENIRNGHDITNIRNIFVRHNGNIYKNELRPLINNLDELPHLDYELYYQKFPQLANSNTKIFMTRRGCIFPCVFCSNKKYHEIYRGKGVYFRLKSIKRVIEEIKIVQNRRPMKWILFNDSALNINRKWLNEFLIEYKREIELGFICNLRVDLADEDMIYKLKNAGLARVDFGLEHGNEEFRKKFLKREITDEQIINTGKWCKKYNIRFHTTNIVGFPNESLDMAFQTVYINQKIQPECSVCGVLQPFPGTEIYDYVNAEKLFCENITIDDFRAQNVWITGQSKVPNLIKHKNINEMINLSCFFDLVVRYPKLERIVRILIKLPPNRFFQFLSQWSLFKVYWKYASDGKERRGLLKRLFKIFFAK
jgi:anaerobic magnesium-protoporphyrin IX monomethyl ester cyclase